RIDLRPAVVDQREASETNGAGRAVDADDRDTGSEGVGRAAHVELGLSVELGLEAGGKPAARRGRRVLDPAHPPLARRNADDGEAAVARYDAPRRRSEKVRRDLTPSAEPLARHER